MGVTISHQSLNDIYLNETKEQRPKNVLCVLCSNSCEWNATVCKFCKRSSHKNGNFDFKTRPLSVLIERRLEVDASVAEQVFHPLVLSCQQNRTPFFDQDFPPCPMSVGKWEKHDVTQWLRIRDILPLSKNDSHYPWSVLNSPEPKDIRQGNIGDCWLMAALALITEKPDMLRQILLTRSITLEGIYALRLCCDGMWKTVIVDDFFPCNDNKQMVFSQSARRQLYVALIEKACAKLYGSYANLCGGSTSEGLFILTGAPCERISIESYPNHRYRDSMWKKIMHACESKLLIGASTGRSDVPHNEYKQIGLNPNHAFSILALYSPNDLEDRFLFTRDPHGVTQYVDHSIPIHMRSALQEVHVDSSSSGTFWIEWSNFLKYFNSITISKFRSDTYDLRYVGHFTISAKDLNTAFYFTILQEATITITIVHHRETRKSQSKHTQSFVLADIDEITGALGSRFLIFKSHRETLTFWDDSLAPGSYIIIPFSISFWTNQLTSNCSNSKHYTFILHSNQKIQVDCINQPASVLADCLIAAAIKYCEKPEGDDLYRFYSTPTKHGARLFVVENRSTANYISFQMDIIHSDTIRHSRGQLKTRDCIPPRHRQLIGILEWAHSSTEIVFASYDILSMNGNSWYNNQPLLEGGQKNLHFPRSY